MIRIAMFSGPRNISTTMMRAFENRRDTAVHDEPYYAWYLATSGAPHPMREAILRSQPTDWDAIGDKLASPATAGETISFEKHIAFHFEFAPALDWVKERRVFHLIRDPRAMIASYAKKHDDIGPILASFKVQLRILRLCEEAGVSCPVIDAADILRNPPAMLAALCNKLQIPFDTAMLSWPAGPRASDGVWAAHWYDAVENSTGFKPLVEKPLELSPEHEEMAADCGADFQFFHKRRLVI